MTTDKSLHWLRGAMDVEVDRPIKWEPQDLSFILTHQLAAPIRADLAELSEDLVKRYDALDARDRAATFADLFNSRSPSLELLRIVKDYAKQIISRREVGIPEEVGAALYYASLSCAFLRCGQRISSLDSDALRVGLNWIISQNWLTPLFREHLEGLDAAAK